MFSENDIRPDIFNANKEIAYKKDLLFLISKMDSFIDVNCPACNKNNKNIYFSKNNMRYVKCSKCKTVYISPRPNNNILNEFYKNSEGYKFWNKYIFPSSEKARIKNIFIPRVNRIIEICNKYNVNKELFVEIGSGYGSFLKEMKDTKYFNRTIGIEPSYDLSMSCRNKGLEIVNKTLDNVRIFKKASMVSSFEVIEHVFNPSSFIRKCKDIIIKNGLLIITCPNVDGFDNYILRENSPTFDHEHLNYFNIKSLSKLIRNNGFRILETLTPGELDVDIVRNRYFDNNRLLNNNEFINRVIFDKSISRSFQEFLKDNLLSGHMWIVAMKGE